MTEAEVTGRPSAGVRRFVVAIFVLLLVPGVIGFDAWPLTAWRLFSLARDDNQTRWEIDAIGSDGAVEAAVDLDELPIGFKLAEWPMAELPSASEARRDEVCLALLGEVRDEIPDTIGLRVVRNRQRLVERDGEWVLVDDREAIHKCGDRAGA